MKRPCEYRHPDATAGAAGGCPICAFFLTGRVPGTPQPPPVPAVQQSPCRHLGEPTGGLRECVSCGGSVRLKVLGCAVHGQCTVEKPVDGLACCKGCPDRAVGAFGILLTAGIGDAFALEGMLTTEERERLDTIYYACPASAEIRELFGALPNYPRLKEHIILPTGQKAYYWKHKVEELVGPLPASVQDWSINTIFPQKRPYTGSSFLAHRLARPQLPPEPYVVVVPYSTWGPWPDRGFSEQDWQTCFEALDRHQVTGMVLCRERLPMPSHPRLLDWQSHTSILETVEVLKGATGYLGIDSALSVLAAKLFPANRISIKSVWAQCYVQARTYFAPRTEFQFLQRSLEVPKWN